MKMHISKTPLLAAILLSLTGCQDDAKVEQNQQPKSLTLAMVPPQASDIKASEELDTGQLPPLNTSREDVSFVRALSGEYQAQLPNKTASASSDEYWLMVTGAELNQGIELPLTQGGSVIRLAPRWDKSSGAPTAPKSIAPDAVQLSSAAGKTENKRLIRRAVDSESLASAGMDDDSSALLLNSDIKPGLYRLQVAAALTATDNYLVNVKEKGSAYRLKLSTPSSLEANTHLELELALENDKAMGSPRLASARLQQASGEQTPLQLSQSGNSWRLQNEQLPMPSSNAGFSELVVDIETQVDNTLVRRTVKTAFKQFYPSARLAPEIKVGWQNGLPSALNFTLELAQSGRFGVSAILTGMDSQGREIAILQSETAAWLTQEQNSLQLPLNLELIQNSGLKPPYGVRAVELKDMGQMARLSYRDKALSFDAL